MPFSKRTQTPIAQPPFCVRGQHATTGPAQHMWGDRNLKLNSIHASVIYQSPWIHWIQPKFCLFKKNSTVQVLSTNRAHIAHSVGRLSCLILCLILCASASMWMKLLGCHIGCQEVGRCRTRGKSGGLIVHRRQSRQVKISNQGRYRQKSKTGVCSFCWHFKWTHKKTWWVQAPQNFEFE